MRYFSYLVLFLLVLLSPVCLSAQQYHLSGLVSDSEKKGIEVVVIELLRADSTYIAHGITDSTGFYTIQSPQSKVIVRASHLSYNTLTCNLDLSQTDHLDLVLEKNDNLINTAVVIGKKETISYVDGNIVISPSHLPGVDVMKASGLLRRLPGVDYGKNEALSVFGSSAVVYIDGVKQRLPANSLYTYLSSLPANAIAEIRVMMNPPAKYGSGPVIEILLNRDLNNGAILDATAFSEYFHKMAGDLGGNVFFMNKKGKWVANTIIGYTNTNGFSDKADSLSFFDNWHFNEYQQTGRGSSFSLNSNASVLLEKEHRLDFGFSAYNTFGDYQTNFKSNTSFDIGESELMQSKAKDDLYTFVLKYSSPENRPFQLSTYYSGLIGGKESNNSCSYETAPERDFSSEIAMAGQMHTWAIDFKNSLFNKKLIIEFGANAEYNIIQDKAIYSSQIDASNTPDFRGKEFVPKGYLGLSYKFGGFTFAARGMVEHTEYLIHSGITDNRISNTDYTPRAQISYKNGIYYGTLVYSRSIQRPDYQDILPGVRYINDYYYSVGNPNLSPVVISGFVFLNNIGPVMVRMDYANVKNAYSGILTTRNNVVYNQMSLYGDMRQYTLSLALPYRFFDGRVSGSFSGNFKIFDYYNLTEQVQSLLSRNRVNYAGSFKWTGAWEITNDLTMEMMTSFTTPTYTLFLNAKPRARIDASVEYSFPKKPLSLSLECEDLFNTNNIWSEKISRDALLVNRRLMYGPIVRLTLQYHFLRGKDVHQEFIDLRPDNSRMK